MSSMEIIACVQCGEQTIAVRPICNLCQADEGLFTRVPEVDCPKCGPSIHCTHSVVEMSAFAREALEEAAMMFDPNRGAKQLIGTTIARVDASAVNEIKLVGTDGVEYTFAAEAGPLGIPVVFVTKFPK